uniref:RNA helicase n=1 Tax=Pseudonaja textilis TaxID=8673 RepID=A0A670YM73_PSETE
MWAKNIAYPKTNKQTKTLYICILPCKNKFFYKQVFTMDIHHLILILLLLIFVYSSGCLDISDVEMFIRINIVQQETLKNLKTKRSKQCNQDHLNKVGDILKQEYVVVLSLPPYQTLPSLMERKVISVWVGRLNLIEYYHILPNRSSLEAPLQFGNYSEKFCLLLHLEEIQMEVDIHRYDMQNVSMFTDKYNKKLLVLKAPGVAENRPSVLKGDHLFVIPAEGQPKYNVPFYKGYVHAVELDQVKLGFSENLYNPNLNNNAEQKEAVRQVVAGTSRPAPYLIFGPPGTGKTVTMVEAIKQVLRCIEGAHVLACAPSNSASDLLCQHLMKHVNPRNIYRMNASNRGYHTIPEDIKPVCNWDEAQSCHVFPRKEKLQSYKVIITTLVTAGRLASADFPQGHFSHVFIDESGHAVEPESLITNVNGGQLVLAGDPKQLGPILRSPLAVQHGLGLSLLERLMCFNPLYQKTNEKYNPQFVTMLLRNYRSHEDILRFSNEKFYDGKLLECGDHLITHSYCYWNELPKAKFPIIFHGVCGEDQQEGRSPSFFNTAEISVLMDYLKKLLLENQGKKGIKTLPKEIGVISPYRKQVEKIRQAINMKLKDLMNINELKVGSVEEFQGQERRVVLISTVRSSSNYFGMDEEFNLGFLNNPKRLNVSLTRAKALLIIIGNPTTLSKDPYWNEFLKYCKRNQAWKGYKHSEVEDELPIAALSALNINDQPAGKERTAVLKATFNC